MPASPLKLAKTLSCVSIKEEAKSTQSSSGEKIEIKVEDLSATMPLVKQTTTVKAFEVLPALYEQHEDVIIFYKSQAHCSNC